MIKTQRNVPEYYYEESRDFQLIGRIFEGILNHVKTAADSMASSTLNKNYDDTLIDLVTSTVGFKSKHEYDVPNLIALVNSFKSILKIKGTKKSIEDCIRVLLKAQNIDEEFEVLINTESFTTNSETIYSRDVTIFIPKEVKDVALLEDMLDYVLPAGFTYSIVIASILGQSLGATTSSMDTLNSTSPLTSEQLGVVTPGLVELDGDELNNADKGLLDNAVVVSPN
jgi:hypothetical protein